MKFPPTNKYDQNLEDKFGENAKLLEEFLNRIQWKVIAYHYWVFFGQFLLSIFLLIVIVRLAMVLF